MARQALSKRSGGSQTPPGRRPRKKPTSKKQQQALFPRLLAFISENLRLHIAPRQLIIVGGIAVLALCMIETIWLLTNKNAVEVHVADKLVGTIKKSKNIDDKTLFAMAQTKLEDNIGAKIQINEEVSLTPVHASSKNMSKEEAIVAAISNAFTYKVEASVITVDGVEILALKNQQEVDAVLNNIIEAFIPVDAKIVKKDFVQKVVTIKKFVEQEDIMTSDKAYTRLTQNAETEKTYTVKGGDNLSRIAAEAGMKLEDLYRINTGINAETVLKIGMEIILVVPKPFLSVETVEEVTYPEVVSKQKEIRQNPNQSRTVSRVIQQGRDGQDEITAHIYRLNGFEEKKEVVSKRTIVEPVNDIVEVGTR